MNLFEKFLKKIKKESNTTATENQEAQLQNMANIEYPNINLEDFVSISIGSGCVGSATGSKHNDFYVYEWFVKETNEIFYVGKGRGNRYKMYHENAPEAEKIRQMFDTDIRFVATGLSEEDALELESKEMIRILNETNDLLTNHMVPFCTKRGFWDRRSSTTPPFKFETAPTLYATEIEEHYFGIKGKPFDQVEYKNLSNVVFIDKTISSEQLEIVYGGNYETYRNEVTSLLEANGNKILSSKYAKTVSAWIYSGDDYVTNNDIDEQQALECIGRQIPSYHLIDVWKLLKSKYNNVEIEITAPIEIKPINNRIPLSKIRNKNNWDKGFDKGYPYWEKGEIERKNGNIEEAIKLFDLARYNGYLAPALYNSYAMVYRKLKDLDNEIDILAEGIERYRITEKDNIQIIIKLEKQKKKAIEKLKKRT